MPLWGLAAAVLSTGAAVAAPAKTVKGASGATIALNDGWALQSSAKLGAAKPEEISSLAFKTEGWTAITVPSTVVGGLVQSKALPDPYFGMNLRQFPGMTYPVGKNFSRIAMAPESPFAVSWWYRKQFAVPASFAGKTVWAHFGGINYRANIYLNGKLVADSKEIAGALRIYDLDVTSFVAPGSENVLAVEVFAPTENQLGITFVDWNPAPPDKLMGLWREVSLSTSGPLAVRHTAMVTHVDGVPATTASAMPVKLAFLALVENATAAAVKGKLKVKLKGEGAQAAFEQELELGPHERKDVSVDSTAVPALALAHARLWWPRQLGTPTLYDLTASIEVGGKVSDEVTRKVGLREIQATLDENKHRLFTINGKKVLIRGAGWSSDLLLNYDRHNVEDQLAYVLDMGLNTVRLEGKLENEHLFDFADRTGLFVMAGWCCCDHWERWKNWKPEDHAVAEQSIRSQIYRLRGHASLVAWLNGSDNPPPPEVESMYLRVEKDLGWPNPVVSSATAKPTTVTGESGVKMSGPYDWVPPSYWLVDKTTGGAHGFNTETSPGPAPPPVESLKRMIPADKLWPQNDVWNFHAGGNVFSTLKVFNEALDARYGKAASLEDFAMKSQLMAYEGIRAMFEGYTRNKYTATGVIQWMLNNAWPGLIWHLYDYYLRPGAGYFGAKSAVESIHPIFGYDDHAVWVANSTYVAQKGLSVSAKVLNLDASEKFAKTEAFELAPDESKQVLTIPEAVWADASATHFVALTVSQGGKVVGRSFYWLSKKPETINFEKGDWYHAPVTSFADFTTLAELPKVKLEVKNRTSRKGEEMTTKVTLVNPSKNLAFFVRLKVNRGAGGEEVLPVRWQDNYLSLLPGEKREVSALYRAQDLGGATPTVEVSGWNLTQ